MSFPLHSEPLDGLELILAINSVLVGKMGNCNWDCYACEVKEALNASWLVVLWR